jgi:hypothetical protein
LQDQPRGLLPPRAGSVMSEPGTDALYQRVLECPDNKLSLSGESAQRVMGGAVLVEGAEAARGGQATGSAARARWLSRRRWRAASAV